MEMTTAFDPVSYAKECIDRRVSEIVPEKIMHATINMHQLAEITGYSERYLRIEFIVTPEAMKLEVGPGRKAAWLYPEIRDCWRNYCIRTGKGKGRIEDA